MCTRCGGSGYRLWSVLDAEDREDLCEAWCDRCEAGRIGREKEEAEDAVAWRRVVIQTMAGSQTVHAAAYAAGDDALAHQIQAALGDDGGDWHVSPCPNPPWATRCAGILVWDPEVGLFRQP